MASPATTAKKKRCKKQNSKPDKTRGENIYVTQSQPGSTTWKYIGNR